MRLLSDDDLNLQGMTDDELDAAWDLWFDLAQATNDSDPPYTHGVFVHLTWEDLEGTNEPSEPAAAAPSADRPAGPGRASRAG